MKTKFYDWILKTEPIYIFEYLKRNYPTKSYYTKSEVNLAIQACTELEDGDLLIATDWFEDCNSASMAANRIIKKLKRTGFIKNRLSSNGYEIVFCYKCNELMNGSPTPHIREYCGSCQMKRQLELKQKWNNA